MRLNAYYYAFDPTDVEMVDRVLSAVACAGKAYHHTDSWSDVSEYCNAESYEPFLRGESPVAWIQNAAADAATLIKGQQAEIERLREQLANAASCLEARSDAKARREWARSFREAIKP